MPQCFDVAVVPSAYHQYLLFATDPELKALGFKPETPVEIAKYACNVREYLDTPLVRKLAQHIQALSTPGDLVDQQIIAALCT